MQDSSLEKQMQQLMSGLEFEPDAAVWENVEREINKEKKKRIAAWWWLAGVLLLCLFGGIVWYNMQDTPPARPVAATMPADSSMEPAHIITEPAHEEATVLTTDKLPQQQAQTAALTPPLATGHRQRQGRVPNRLVGGKEKKVQENVVANHTTQPVTGGTLPMTIVQNSSPLPNGNLWQGSGSVQNNGSEQRVGLLQSSALQSNVPAHSSTIADSAVPEIKTVLPFIDASLITNNEAGSISGQAAVNAYYNPFTPAVIAPLKKRTWRISPVAGVGIAANIGGVNSTSGFSSSVTGNYFGWVATPDKNAAADNLSSNPNAGTGGGSTFIYYFSNQRLTHPKASFRFGFELEKYMTPRWRFLTGAQYQFLSYNSIIKSKVSGNFSSNLDAYTTTTNFLYKLNYIAVPLQLQYRISVPFAVTAGILNSFSLTGRQNDARIKEAMRTYIPSASVMFDIMLYNRKQQVWKISPYVQYGFMSNFKGTLEDKRMLQTGVQAVFQINK